MSQQQQDKPGNGEGQAPEQQKKQAKSVQQQSTAEWVTLIVSLLIVLVAIGALTYYYFASGAPQEPTLVIEPQFEQMRAAEGAFYLPIEVRNVGVPTASDVTVQVTLQPVSGEAETVSFTIAFLPGGGRARATVVFQNSPDAGTLSYVFSFSRPE